MKHMLSKLALGAASMFLTASAFTYVDMDDRLDILEKSMQEVSARNPQDTLGASFTTSRPETVGNNWYAMLGVIYWHPKMGGTEYAYTNTTENIIIIRGGGQREETTFTIRRPNPPSGAVKANDFGWDMGLKAGIGYKTPHDDWDVFARYTWFNSEDGSSNRKDDPSMLVAIKSLAALLAGHAKSNVNIDYNNIEIELARAFFISGKLSLRPHFDMKMMWLNLEQNITYTFTKIFRSPFAGLDFKIGECLPKG